jgi:hypothetical protein
MDKGMEQPLTFSPQQALDYARNIAQPRRVGSEGEQAVATEIRNVLTGFGYRVEQQPFQFIAALHGWIRLELVVGSLLILAIMMLRGISPWAPILPAILLLSLIFLTNPLHRWIQSISLLPGVQPKDPPSVRLLSWLGPRFKSANIIASFPINSHDGAAPHLYLMAHYDSKSQSLPIPIRMLLFALFILGGFSTSTMTILSLLIPELGPLLPYFAWGSLLFGIPLIYMDVGNDSPGAIDNASGVGMVLHLAELLAKHQELIQHLHVTFLLTSAEEEGLMGAQAYVEMNETELGRQALKGGLYVLNFDGIGTQGKLVLDKIPQKQTKNDSLGDWVQDICAELNIPLGMFPSIGALMDHAPFAHHGLEAISLATVGKAAWSVHTRRDTVGKLHPTGFEQAGHIALELIQRLAHKEIPSPLKGEKRISESD